MTLTDGLHLSKKEIMQAHFVALLC